MSELRFGSVCSGIEAASVAWNPLGWRAAWLSEIEPFPSAVLAHHYPDVPNLGDMTTLPERILSGEVEAPDLFCGGTPCQAFSVAGLRNSLDDARGNLSLTFVGIANAIDHVRSVRRDDPAIIFWENVPGVLSSKDNAFGCFLAALAGEDEPIIPSGEKWTNAGCVYGPQRAVAWRVLDAQYFGVAQRRRRVFVVASARNDFDPAAVLFEFDGVRRDTAPCREKGQGFAAGIESGATVSDYEVAGTLDKGIPGRGIGHNGNYDSQVMAVRMVAFGEYVDDGTPSAMKARDYKDATDLVTQTFSIPAIGHIVQDEVASTMTRHTGSGSGETQNPAFVAQPMVLMDQGGSVMNIEYDMVGTLRRETHGHEPVIVQGCEFGPSGGRFTDLNPTLDTRAKDGPIRNQLAGAVIQVVAAQMVAFGEYVDDGTAVAEPISIHPHCIGRAPEAGPQGKEYLLDGSAYCMDSRGQPQAVVQAIPLDMRNAGRDPEKHDAMNRQGVVVGEPGDPAHTVTSAFVHGVACIGGLHPNAAISNDQSPTLTSAMGMGGGHIAIVAHAIPIDTMNMTPGHSSGGLGFGQPGDPSFTLTKGHSHAVAQPIAFTRCDHGGDAVVDGTPTMRCGSNYSAHLAAAIPKMAVHEAAQPIAFNIASGKGELKDDIHVTDARISKTIDASGSNPSMHQGGAAIVQTMQVRRLTPVECERLQGFPDNYTNIPWRKKPEAPDGPRYKALGNSWAVPNVRWIGKRIQDALNDL